MARIFEDNFNGTLGTALVDHTPATGTSWADYSQWGGNADGLDLDGDATDAGVYCPTANQAKLCAADPVPATGLVTVWFTLQRLTTSNVSPPHIIMRAHPTQMTGYQVRHNVGSNRFELVRYDNGTPTSVLKTWTGVTLGTPSITAFKVTIEDVGGNPVITMYYADGTQIGTAYTDTNAAKIVQDTSQKVGVYATNSLNVTSTTGTHLTFFAIDDASAGSPPPTLTSIAPDEGTENGGTAVTLTGTDFVSGATVTIGGAACTSVTFVSSTSITAVTPAGTVGARDLVVTNPDTQTDTLTGGFTYLSDVPVVTITSPPGAAIAVTSGTKIVIEFTATDLTDGNIAAISDVTSSNTADGTIGWLGAGSPLTVDTAGMSAGARTITVTATDSDTDVGTDTFTLTIGTSSSALEPYLRARAMAAELGGY
jgi:hypothetical protein